MVTPLYLFACAFAIAQAAPGDSSEWALAPRLVRGQELVYRGTYTEESCGSSVEFIRSYRLENRIFVLDQNNKGADIACLTTWKARGATGVQAEIDSVRLAVGFVDRQGAVRGDGSWLTCLDGPPTVECGAFVEAPLRRLGQMEPWKTLEQGRPPRDWHIEAVEVVNGNRCVKVIGQQQSDDWNKPRADHTAWRRTDIVWLTPRGGYAHKVERTIERREPAHQEPTQRLVVKYELESSLQYPAQLFEDRKRDIIQVQNWLETLTPLLNRAAEVGPRPFEAILSQTKKYLDTRTPTPYREAIRHVQHLAEAGSRGENPPDTSSNGETPASTVATLGRPAPDFLATDLQTRQSARLRHLLGQPLLLVFYDPTTPLGEDVLRFAKKISDERTGQVNVVGLACTNDPKKALQQRAELHIGFPILSGTGLRLSYAVDATPKFVVLDGNGLVRGSYIGWGPETPESVLADLEHCKPAPSR
jgi:peroxiredoxin